jgi:aminomethyltransferase
MWWKDIIVSRTGYTGEDGFELIVSKKEVESLWSQFMVEKTQPCGLGARDTLRLEAGLPLYGHEYDDETTPLEAGYGWAVKLGKIDFVGKAALQKQKETGLAKKLVGLEVDGQLIPRDGCLVYSEEGSTLIGKVTSGNFSPTFKKPIAMAYLSSDKALLGGGVLVEIRQRRLPAKIVAKTFYKR